MVIFGATLEVVRQDCRANVSHQNLHKSSIWTEIARCALLKRRGALVVWEAYETGHHVEVL